MIGIIVVMIVSVIVMYNQHTNYIKDKNKINELEEMLDRYYKEREKRLKDNDLIK
jgi:fructoselysine-6-P-deglycase FrlB-like protein